MMENSFMGKTVRYKSYHRPFDVLTGTVVAETLDPDRGIKPRKFVIKPDKPTGDFVGNVVRYMPYGDEHVGFECSCEDIILP